MVLKGRIHKNVFTTDIMAPSQNLDVSLCPSETELLLWHKMQVSHYSTKLISKELALGLPKSRYNKDKVLETSGKFFGDSLCFLPASFMQGFFHVKMLVSIYFFTLHLLAYLPGSFKLSCSDSGGCPIRVWI